MIYGIRNYKWIIKFYFLFAKRWKKLKKRNKTITIKFCYLYFLIQFLDLGWKNLTWWRYYIRQCCWVKSVYIGTIIYHSLKQYSKVSILFELFTYLKRQIGTIFSFPQAFLCPKSTHSFTAIFKLSPDMKLPFK